MIKGYIGLAILLFMLSAAYGAKYYYDTTQNKIAQLQENNVKLETAVASKDLVINDMKKTAKELEAINNQLALDLSQAQNYTDDLRKKLQEHDLTRLSLKKPGMIEKRVNDGTKNILSELESITSQ